MLGTSTAKAVIGCRIPQKKLFLKKKVKTFDHNYPEDQVFHKGHKLWTEIDIPIPELDVISWPNKLNLKSGKCYLAESDDASLIAVAMYSQVTTRDVKRANLIVFPKGFSIIKARSYLRKCLNPLDLWNEKEFGLWAIIGPYCSMPKEVTNVWDNSKFENKPVDYSISNDIGKKN